MWNQKLPRWSLALALAGVLAGCSRSDRAESAHGTEGPIDRPAAASTPEPSPLDTTYVIEGEPVALVHGRAERAAAPGSATMERTTVSGEPRYGDLDGDGDSDAVVLLIHDGGGSGSFSYVAAAVREGERFNGSDAILLGDRIGDPQIRIENGVVHADFLARPEDVSYAEPPTEKRSLQMTVQGRSLQVRPE